MRTKSRLACDFYLTRLVIDFHDLQMYIIQYHIYTIHPPCELRQITFNLAILTVTLFHIFNCPNHLVDECRYTFSYLFNKLFIGLLDGLWTG